MRQTPLPTQLDEFNRQVNYVQKVGALKWTSSCPNCGGEVHSDGKWPDRCVWWADEGRPRGACMRCGKIFFPGKHDNLFMSAQELERRRKLREQQWLSEQAEEKRRRERFAQFTTDELWKELHNRLTEEHRHWWEAQGIGAYWQDFWQLGYTPDKAFKVGDKLYHSPAMTIPIFDLGWEPKNIQYRLLREIPGSGKYRPEIHTPAAFISRPDMTLDVDEVVIVEGSKKAMVVYLYLDYKEEQFQTVGVPSMNSWAGMEQRFENAGRVYVMLDPDSMKRPIRAPDDWQPYPVKLCKKIGLKSRLVELPAKPDDMLLKHGATSDTFREAFRNARRVH